MRLPLLFLLPLVLLCACKGGGPGGREAGAPIVTVETVASSRFANRIDAVGTALANEQVVLAAPVTERIVRLNFRDGGYVGAGQVVALLAQGQEDALLAEAGVRAQEAEQQLDRLEALRTRGFATKSAVDAQNALAGSARAQAEGARASIGDRVIRAPFGGWLSLRNISLGAIVTAGTEIATISDISRIKLDFAVPETLLSALSVGQPIDAVAAAYPGRPFRGTIQTIDTVVNAETRAVTVRAILPNPDKMLKPGMLLTVAVESAARNAIAIPELAVVGEGDRSFVYVLGNADMVRRVPVKIGARQNGVVEILEGLKPGQRIVTEGVVKLADGMKIRLAGSKAGPGGKPAPARN